MELLEKVAIGLDKAIADDEYCGKEKSDSKNWKAVIDGLQGKGDPAELRKNLLADGLSDPVSGGHPSKLASGWDIEDCGRSHFPYQSHHLIPEKQLPKHRVTFWLIKNSKKTHPRYKLEADTSYDTNDAMNGYFMPFASTTHQWATTSSVARKSRICFEMMRRTMIQLHQGPHSKGDYLEDEEIETAGYKSMVKRLLNVIADRTENHVEDCPVCKSKGKPIKVQPLDQVVRHMHRVSKTLKGLCVLNRIFVSRRAANYFNKYRSGGFIQHPPNPLI